MTTIDTSGWTRFATSDNADFYEIEPHVLAVVPFEGTVDDATTARQSIELQLEHLRRTGRRAGVVVFLDPVVAQDAGARTVYRELPDPTFQLCFALVGSSALGRAVGSLFLGLSRPLVPTRMFGDLSAALGWVRSRLEKT